MISADEWNEAAATKTLDLAEMDALVQKSVDAWADHDAKKAVATEAFHAAEAIDLQILEALKAAGKKKYVVDELGTISINSKSVVRVPGDLPSKKAFIDHLRSTLTEEAFYALVTVNSQTLNSWYAQKLEEAAASGQIGFQIPGIADPTMREGLSFHKARSKKQK